MLLLTAETSLQLFIYQPGLHYVQTSTYTDAQGVKRCPFTRGKYNNPQNLTVGAYLLILNHKRPAGTPEFVALTWDEVFPLLQAAEAAKYISPTWNEITEERWCELLNVLPPEKWKTVKGCEIFRMSEYTCGNITTHAVRIGGRFFSRECRTSTPYETIADEVAAFARLTPSHV